ncbi:MAG: DUF4399 domain-containing protein [Gammaproteobacteria bacterium]
MPNFRTKLSVFTAIIGISSLSFASGTPSAKDAMAYIISPKDGETVSSPFKVQFGLSGMGVAPAGIDKKNTGHHHLLIDSKDLPEMKSPMGKNVKHFGGGQSETVLSLEPGEHSLQLILGDKNHTPHTPPVVSKIITITVK